MDTFVKMRHYINFNKRLLPNRVLLLEEKIDENTKRINELFDIFDPKDIANNKIFFEGELYDAYSLLIEILKNIDKKIIIITKNIDNTLKEKYESEYNNVAFINNKSFHDRFIIIDRNKLYSCGASFKDLGKKCFAINKIEIKEYLDRILNTIYK